MGGGGSGIGRLMCLRFSRLGATVVTWDINKVSNEETVAMIKAEGKKAYSYTVDMSSKEAIYDTAKKTQSDVGHVSIIVNKASLAGHSGTHKLVDYCASKFAAVGLDESLRVELFVQGHSDYIKTTVVCPYYISTGMFAGVQSKIIPILEPSFVADQVVSAVLT